MFDSRGCLRYLLSAVVGFYVVIGDRLDEMERGTEESGFGIA
ncbi:MAG TPA: hypothetical protein V6D12_06720 [Candidatus Obscuribacterales bacterium]